ncbi:ArsR/SmtB family transcription factor [Croceicoccus marinus]|uniref:Winged helix-turn-helix transcriptional regulator n=1 Tax=Croceicoccus marinus TaxID=450378 RepID=A0A7G6VTQ3_9SPHN|nr:metalloregulator ArsR/SmtB family transcription factor [Croceicoccus marinus]QNE05118.1 winged helix-turn-helix transcriptional regulator [Croceicoccus marinus]
MEKMDVVAKLSALAQPTRLEIFLAIASAPNGITSTDVAEQTDTMPNNASVHLSILRNAGLVRSSKSGRSVTYRAELDALRSLSDFLRSAPD